MLIIIILNEILKSAGRIIEIICGISVSLKNRVSSLPLHMLYLFHRAGLQCASRASHLLMDGGSSAMLPKAKALISQGFCFGGF